MNETWILEELWTGIRQLKKKEKANYHLILIQKVKEHDIYAVFAES